MIWRVQDVSPILEGKSKTVRDEKWTREVDHVLCYFLFILYVQRSLVVDLWSTEVEVYYVRSPRELRSLQDLVPGFHGFAELRSLPPLIKVFGKRNFVVHRKIVPIEQAGRERGLCHAAQDEAIEGLWGHRSCCGQEDHLRC